MAFATIVAAPGLSPARRRRAAEVGPANVRVRTSYPSLLRSAGFVDVEAADVTSGYRSTIERWFRETERRRDHLRSFVGDDEIDERQARRAGASVAVDDGLLQRWTFVARRRRGRRP